MIRILAIISIILAAIGLGMIMFGLPKDENHEYQVPERNTDSATGAGNPKRG
jgi:putative Mn2+ efflux pump MntP